MPKPKKLYCFVDETGQDAGSQLFIVATVIAWDDLPALRASLMELEKKLTIGTKNKYKKQTPVKGSALSPILEIAP